ncbi:MAG: stage II sporulation protein M [Firmicutes bacterium HGW-Firmicutes-14]|jgi:stage II sporulation protein M|nr:MAG: stage II sporulation protein M [Firmicutes bacterium HGW-Firmicutes-14]
MRFWVKQVVKEYLKQKWYLILFVTVFLCMGVFFGATAAKVISTDQADHLSAYLHGFLDKVSSTPVSEQSYLRQTVFNNLYILIAIYVLGLTVVGIPAVLAAVFTRGFILGFTIGFLVREMAFKGFLFALVSILPHNILVIPAVIAGGVAALSFSGLMVKRRFRSGNASITGYLGIYTAAMIILCLVTGAAGLVETYITPVFIKTAATYII